MREHLAHLGVRLNAHLLEHRGPKSVDDLLRVVALLEVLGEVSSGEVAPLGVIPLEGVPNLPHERNGRDDALLGFRLDDALFLRLLGFFLRLSLGFLLRLRLFLLPRRLSLRVLRRRRRRFRGGRVDDVPRPAFVFAGELRVLPRERIAILDEPRVDYVLNPLAHLPPLRLLHRLLQLDRRAFHLL